MIRVCREETRGGEVRRAVFDAQKSNPASPTDSCPCSTSEQIAAGQDAAFSAIVGIDRAEGVPVDRRGRPVEEFVTIAA